LVLFGYSGGLLSCYATTLPHYHAMTWYVKQYRQTKKKTFRKPENTLALYMQHIVDQCNYTTSSNTLH